MPSMILATNSLHTAPACSLSMLSLTNTTSSEDRNTESSKSSSRKGRGYRKASIAIFHLSNPYPSKCYKTPEHLFRLSPRQTLFRSRYERFCGKFSNFAAKQPLTMEQKFGKNSIDIEALREFCEREGKEVTYRKGDQMEHEGDPARWFGFVTEGCFKYLR